VGSLNLRLDQTNELVMKRWKQPPPLEELAREPTRDTSWGLQTRSRSLEGDASMSWSAVLYLGKYAVFFSGFAFNQTTFPTEPVGLPIIRSRDVLLDTARLTTAALFTADYLKSNIGEF